MLDSAWSWQGYLQAVLVSVEGRASLCALLLHLAGLWSKLLRIKLQLTWKLLNIGEQHIPLGPEVLLRLYSSADGI